MIMQATGKRPGWQRVVFLCVGMTALAGCDDAGNFNPFKLNPKETSASDAATGEGAGAAAGQSVKLVERDVEAPDVFQVTDMGLWDGRPSLGGVWVAHPDVKDPERVIIRNTANSSFVIGALFRRERENPGPVFQVSSDAAAALGLLAGAPAELNVTALRREATPVAPAKAPTSQAPTAQAEDMAAPDGVETTALDPVIGAAAAVKKVEAEAKQAAPAPKAAKKKSSSLDKPFIQIGIFSVEQNAKNTATAMRQAGMLPTVKEHTTQGKTFWRVIVGPASSKSDRTVLLKKIKGVGFDDAYPVTN